MNIPSITGSEKLGAAGTDRHEVSSRRITEDYDREILKAIASGERLTQRSLSRDLGVALGLTNLLIRRLVAKGYVKVAKIGKRHIKSLMTADGLEALAVATRTSLENTVHLYTETREQIRVILDQVSSVCPRSPDGSKRIAFYGAGDVAEIAFVSLQRTDLTLVGIVDDQRTGRFFHLPISGPHELSGETVSGASYSRIVVTTVRHGDRIRLQLKARGVADRCVSYLERWSSARARFSLRDVANMPILRERV